MTDDKSAKTAAPAPPAMSVPILGQPGPQVGVGLGADAFEHLKALELLLDSGFAVHHAHDIKNPAGRFGVLVMRDNAVVAEGWGQTIGTALRRMGEELAPKLGGVLFYHKKSSHR